MWGLWFAACTGGSDSDTEVVDTDVDDTDDTDVAPRLTDAQTQAIVAAVESDLKKSANRNASGVQLAVWLDGDVVYEVGIGSADPGAEVEVGVDRLFQIGSDTKKIAALALLQQEAAGTLSVDDRVAGAVDGLVLAASPAWAGDTTLHQLVSHQGGLYDYTPWDDDPGDDVLRGRAFGVFASDGWAHAPGGAMWNYANPNFSLVGLATEQAAGRPWADVVEDDLFAPLGMTRSFARESAVEADGNYALGRGYIQDAPPADPFDPFDGSAVYRVGTADLTEIADNGFTRPAGLVWSTAGDQARLAGFLVDGDPTVLDAARLAKVHAPHVRLYPALDGQSYGYGLFVFDGVSLFSGYYEVPVWSHGGNTLTFTSTFYALPEQRVAVSILSNGYANDFTATIATTLEAVVGDRLPAPVSPPPLPMIETDHAALVGTYEDPAWGPIIIGEADGKLTIDMPTLDSMGVSMGSTLKLALTDVYTVPIAGTPYDFTFIADDSGAYRWIRNRQLVGTRVPVGVAPSVSPHRPIDRAAFLVGLAEAGQMRAWAAPFRD